MREAQNINFSISNMNEEIKGKPIRKYTPKESLNVNFDEIVTFIKNKKYPKSTEEKLIDIAKKIPHGSYNNFKKNYKKYLK